MVVDTQDPLTSLVFVVVPMNGEEPCLRHPRPLQRPQNVVGMGDTDVLYRSQPRQPANKSRRSDVKYPQHILKTNCVLIFVSPLPLTTCLLRWWAHDHLSHPRALLHPLRTRPKPCASDSGLRI